MLLVRNNLATKIATFVLHHGNIKFHKISVQHQRPQISLKHCTVSSSFSSFLGGSGQGIM